MKKTLSIILAILMIVTSVPFAFATESDGVKTTLDISKGKIVISDSGVTVDSQSVEVDPDGYIITGRSEGLDTALLISNSSGSEKDFDIVFKNVTIISGDWSSAFVVDGGSSPIVLNILFEGENIISADNHPPIEGRSGHIVNITYSEDSVPQLIRRDKSGHICSSRLVVYINGKQVGEDGHPHENTDNVQTCKGYKCNICNNYFGEKDENAHQSNGEQTCKGYRCDLCYVYYGEAGEHISSRRTCLGEVCKNCGVFYGEKDVNAHDWAWGYCRYCDEKLPDDVQCSHKISGYTGICTYCAYVDENSDKLLLDVYFNSGVLDAFDNRRRNLMRTYDASKVDEICKSINEEYADLRNTRADRFCALFENDYDATVGESKAAIEALMAEDNKLADMLKNCLSGVHNIDEFTSNNDATCVSNGTKYGDCIFCSAKNVTVEDENTKLSSCYSNDGDEYCDGCGEQLICEDCGRPTHADTFIQNLVCLIIMFINLIKTAF